MAFKNSRFNVRNHGGVGNGVADDTAAIVAADAAATAAGGGTVYLPAGTWMVNNAMPPLTGNSLLGAGRKVSIVKGLPQTFVPNHGLMQVVEHSNFRVSELCFDLTGPTFPHGYGNPGFVYFGLQLVLCDRVVVDHCDFIGIQPHTLGLSIDGCANFGVDSNFFYMPSPVGDHINQAISIGVNSGAGGPHTVTNNVMIGTGLDSNMADGYIAGNYVSGVHFGGGLAFGPLPGCVRQRIIGNTCVAGVGLDMNSTYVDGIECWAYQSIIKDNICNGNSGAGIVVGAGFMVVANNICMNNGQSDVSAAGITAMSIPNGYAFLNSLVTSNLCTDNQATKTQKYGYAEYNNGGGNMYSTGTLIVDVNQFAGNKLGNSLLT